METILIIDDEQTNRIVLKELLSVEAKIILAKSGEQGLKLAKKYLPDLILLDVMMPELSGFEVITELKNQAETKDISVIFITGLADSDDEEKGFKLGARDYIHKPFKPNIVLVRVLNHLELVRQRKILNQIAHIDGLTGIPNRRQLDLFIEKEVSQVKREKSSMVLAMLDVDYFKLYNDNYGHGPGDIVLKKIGQVLTNHFNRPRDFVARYGGEEFMAVLPGSDLAGAKVILEQLLNAIRACGIDHQHSLVADHVTVSIGAILIEHTTALDLAAIFKQADKNLYQAKNNGRNSLVIQ
jgi:diguanylate cyclase (GGDEF)-like protein